MVNLRAGVIGKVTTKLQRYSPEILTGVGLASMTGGAILAVRKTLTLSELMEDIEFRIHEVKHTRELAENNSDVEPYETYNRDIRKAYVLNALDMTKHYGPAVSLFLAGGVSILVAHGIMHKRNVALVAAYNAIEKSFQAYRQRVIDDLGVEKDRDYRYGITEKTETVDGKKVSVIEIDPTKMSPYVRLFDETNDQWQDAPGYNQFFLTSEQNMLNDKLRAMGHVFLNEVYDRLGFPRTQEGNVVGWIISKDGGDNFIDFSIYDASVQAKRNFVNGYERSIWLDFNVDGEILSKI